MATGNCPVTMVLIVERLRDHPDHDHADERANDHCEDPPEDRRSKQRADDDRRHESCECSSSYHGDIKHEGSLHGVACRV